NHRIVLRQVDVRDSDIRRIKRHSHRRKQGDEGIVSSGGGIILINAVAEIPKHPPADDPWNETLPRRRIGGGLFRYSITDGNRERMNPGRYRARRAKRPRSPSALRPVLDRVAQETLSGVADGNARYRAFPFGERDGKRIGDEGNTRRENASRT